MSGKSKSLNSEIIAICGGSGSGKTTLARELRRNLGPDRSTLIYQDWYYFDQSSQFDYDGGKVNFDHPSSLDFELLAKHLASLRLGQRIKAPQYDFAQHRRSQEYLEVEPRPIVLVDGILLLHSTELRPLFNLGIFIDTSEGVRLERRLLRDISERGRHRSGVLEQFAKQVKPMHDLYVEPSKIHADRIYSGEGDLLETVKSVSDLCVELSS